MKERFQSRGHIVLQDEFAYNIDSIANSFRNSPTFVLAGQDGRTILELTHACIPRVNVRMRGKLACVTGLNDVHQTKSDGWVSFLNGRIPSEPVNKCLTHNHDFLVWVFMPIRFTHENQLGAA